MHPPPPPLSIAFGLVVPYVLNKKNIKKNKTGQADDRRRDQHLEALHGERRALTAEILQGFGLRYVRSRVLSRSRGRGRLHNVDAMARARGPFMSRRTSLGTSAPDT